MALLHPCIICHHHVSPPGRRLKSIVSIILYSLAVGWEATHGRKVVSRHFVEQDSHATKAA